MKNQRLLAVILGLGILMNILPALAWADDQQYVNISPNQVIQVENGKTKVPLKATWGNISGTMQAGAVVGLAMGDTIALEGTFVADSGTIYSVKDFIVTLAGSPSKVKPAAPSPSTAVQQPTQKIKVVLDGKMLSFSQDPIMQNGAVLLPFRTILEKLGAVVQYDVNSHQIEAICADKGLAILFSAGDPNATIIYNGGKTETYKMNQPAVVVNNTTLVPVRFISETLGNKVSWDANSQTVTITGQGASSATSAVSTKPAANARDNKIKVTVTKVTRAEGNPAPNQNETYISRAQGFLDIHYIAQNKSGVSYKQTYTSTAKSGYEYIVVEFQVSQVSKAINLQRIGHAESTLFDTSGKSYSSNHWINYNVAFGTDWRKEWLVRDNASCEIDFLVPQGTAPDYMNLQYSYAGNSGEDTAILKVPLDGRI